MIPTPEPGVCKHYWPLFPFRRKHDALRSGFVKGCEMQLLHDHVGFDHFPPPSSCSFADEHRALSFVYTVRDGDEMSHFKHTGSDALELYNNASIKRASTTPTTDALINLPTSEGGACVQA